MVKLCSVLVCTSLKWKRGRKVLTKVYRHSSSSCSTSKRPLISGDVNLVEKYIELKVGMARGIPHSSFLEVPDHFSLLDSQRNKFYHSSYPRVLAKIPRGPWRPWNILLLAVRDKLFYWNINVHLKVGYILFWIFVILLWKTFNCPYWVVEWNDKPIAP